MNYETVYANANKCQNQAREAYQRGDKRRGEDLTLRADELFSLAKEIKVNADDT